MQTAKQMLMQLKDFPDSGVTQMTLIVRVYANGVISVNGHQVGREGSVPDPYGELAEVAAGMVRELAQHRRRQGR